MNLVENLLGGCVVSNTQYASLVSATTTSFHLMSKCLSVRSHDGGLGKLCTFNLCLGFVAVASEAGAVEFPGAELDIIVFVSDWRRVKDLCMRVAGGGA